MAVLIHVLTNDRMDVDIVKAALETLDQLCTSDKMDGSEVRVRRVGLRWLVKSICNAIGE